VIETAKLPFAFKVDRAGDAGTGRRRAIEGMLGTDPRRRHVWRPAIRKGAADRRRSRPLAARGSAHNVATESQCELAHLAYAGAQVGRILVR